MDRKTVYLITGANRGIGLALTTTLLLRPSHSVIATVRPSSLDESTRQSLHSLPRHQTSSLILLPLDVRSTLSTYNSIIEKLGHDHGIEHINAVVANAGSSPGFRSILETSEDDIKEDFETNTLGLFKLFKSCWPLLSNAPKVIPGHGRELPLKQDIASMKKFIYITSTVGSIAILGQESFPSTGYGIAKCGGNWLSKKIAVEFKDSDLLVGVLHPGWVKTNMGQKLADTVGVKEPPLTVEDSAKGVLEQIDTLTPEKSGQFLSYTGQALPW